MLYQSMTEDPMGRRTKKTKISVNREINRQEALKLRLLGLTYAQIGARMNISESMAHKHVKTAIDESRKVTKELADDVIFMDVRRIEKYMHDLSDQCGDGEVKAIDQSLKLILARQKMLGILAPEKVAVVDSSGSDIEDNSIAVMLAQKLADNDPERAEKLLQGSAKVTRSDLALEIMRGNQG